MTKTYKINGTEIERLSNKVYPSQDDFNREIHTKFNSLLEALNGFKMPTRTPEQKQIEALSDKEKTIYQTKCDCIYFNGITTKCAMHIEPKQEECKHDWIEYDREEGNTPIDICRNCPAERKPKQSTSLKEEITQMIYWNRQAPINTADKILKLLQSYLLKEIENTELYSGDIKTIKEIINNIK